MRCPDCNKNVRVELNDEPEVTLENVDPVSSRWFGTVNLEQTCVECDRVLTEGVGEFETTVTLDHDEDDGEDHDQDADVSVEHIEEHGRGKKRTYTVLVAYTVTCSCGAEYSGNESVDILAADMEPVA
jgi:hypothetical protein